MPSTTPCLRRRASSTPSRRTRRDCPVPDVRGFLPILLGFAIGPFLSGCAGPQVVVPDELVRGTRLPSSDLEDAVREHHIKTVVNLDGIHPGEEWYRELRSTCERARVEQVDIALDADAPDREEMSKLLSTYHHAKRPIWIQSRWGSARTGLAAGVYRLAVLEQNIEEARKELPFWQWRAIPWSKVSSHDQFLSAWTSEADFHERYRLLGDSPRRAIELAQADEFAVPASASFKHNDPPMKAVSAKLTWEQMQEATQSIVGPSDDVYMFGTGPYPQQGRVLRDYSAVLVNGPVPEGPLITGRMTSHAEPLSAREPSARPRSSAKGDANPTWARLGRPSDPPIGDVGNR